jgi:hypothetical protein
MPDVSDPEPMQLRAEADFLQLYLLVHVEARRQRREDVGPDSLLLCRSEEAEADPVNRIARASDCI